MVLKGNNKYLTWVIWIVIGGCMRDGGNGYVSNVNVGFELFLMGVNGHVFLHHY